MCLQFDRLWLIQRIIVNEKTSAFKLSVCTVYLDDIIIFSETQADNVRHLETVVDRLERAMLKVKLSKCELGKTSLKFLGHIVGEGQIRPNPEKVEALYHSSLPKTAKQLLGFLGLASYYRKFVKTSPRSRHR